MKMGAANEAADDESGKAAPVGDETVSAQAKAEPVKTEIVRLLKESGGYLSGQELCERLHVSRTAVWKVVEQLRGEGYQIEAVRRRGYRLLEAADVLTAAEFATCMPDCWPGAWLDCRDTVDSTNNQARRLAEKGAPEGTLVIAETQTAGKGRRGRSWISPPGTGIWFSLILRPDILPAFAPMLTLVTALSVADAVEEVCHLPAKIKWPNDIVLSGRKICGILTEMSAEAEQVHYVVTGIGINANMKEFPEEIAKTATSLYLESGSPVRRSHVAAAVMRHMKTRYTEFLRTSDLTGLERDYTARLVNLNQEVMVLDPAGGYRGVCLGIDDRGLLLVRRPEETVEKVMSGEVSVRGVYGYV